MQTMRFLAAVLVVMFAVSTPCYAIPALQLYIEGATYDNESETWVASSSDTLRLWVIGDVGSYGTIADVKLSAAYDAAFTPTFTFTPSQTGDYLGYTDSTTPVAPTYIQTQVVTDSSGPFPLLGDGSTLPTHDVFVPGIAWQEFALGNFTSTDSLIGDFTADSSGSLVTQTGDKTGQINVYDIAITGVPSEFTVHFDAYDHYTTGTVKYVFAPFSHDGETTNVPEPTSLLLLGLSLIAMRAATIKKIGGKSRKRRDG
jgi:hypothetical protein